MLNFIKRWSGLIAVLASVGTPQHVYAEPQASDRANAESTDDNVAQAQEVVVTAQRREEDISKVPISITAFSQASMDDLGIKSLSDLTGVVPGLRIPHPDTTNNANSTIAIRGILSGGNTPTTQIYIDETPVAIREMRQGGPSGSFFPDIFDLERIEVLRGPQGTLFGSSAMGGAIRFITPQPNLQEASGYAKAEFASSDGGEPSYIAALAYGAPIVEGKAGFRVSGWYRVDGGYIDNVNPYTQQLVKRNSNEADAYGGRAAFAFLPSENLTITPAVFIQHQTTDNLSAVWVRPSLGENVSGDSPSQPNDDKVLIPSLAIKYELSGITFQSDTSYLERDFDTINDTSQLLPAIFNNQMLVTPPSFSITQNQFGGTKAWQQQFRLTSTNESRFQWVAGAFFRRARETLDQRVTPDLSPMTQALYGRSSIEFFGVPSYVVDGQAHAQFTTFKATDEQRALFGDVSYQITDRLKVNLGVRVERSLVKEQTQQLAGPFSGTAFARRELEDQKDTPVNPRVSIAYQHNERNMFYASAGKGYRSGGANHAGNLVNPRCPPVLSLLGIGETPLTFDSDSLWSYELGAKNSMLDGRLSVQTSVFRIDWSDIQTQYNEQGCGTFTINRGKATVDGVELQMAMAPTDWLRLGGNVSYMDAYYDESEFGAPVNGVPRLLHAKDNLAQVLPWTAALNAELSWSVGALWGGARSYIRADYRWQDRLPGGNPAAASYNLFRDQLRDPSFDELNLRIGIVREALDISAFVNNVTDTDPVLSFKEIGTRGRADYPLAYRGVIRPLTVGVTAVYRF